MLWSRHFHTYCFKKIILYGFFIRVINISFCNPDLFYGFAEKKSQNIPILSASRVA